MRYRKICPYLRKESKTLLREEINCLQLTSSEKEQERLEFAEEEQEREQWQWYDDLLMMDLEREEELSRRAMWESNLLDQL